MRILALPHGIALAHVTRPLEIAKALRDRGHEVTFACKSRYDHFIVQSGFECRPIVTEKPEKALARVRHGKRYEDDDRMLIRYIADEQRVIREVKPDVVLGDLRPTLSVSTELVGVPYVTITNACLTKYYAAKHSAPETLPLTRLLGVRIAGPLVPLLQRLMLRMMAGPIKRFRRKHGMKPVKNMLDVLESPVLNLIADLPEFAPTSALPAHFRYVGPIIWEPPIPPPPWLGSLAPSKKAVYVTLGSTGHADEVLNVLIRALSRLDLEVMATTGSTSPYGNWPGNVYCTQFAPGHLLARRADLVVCHGGNGTIYQALEAGTPLLGLPTFVEQEYHMDRVVALGTGIKISPMRLSPGAIRRACLLLLSDARFHSQAERISQEIEACDAPVTAAQLIEAL